MRAWQVVALLILGLQGLALYLFGQPFLCECGRVSLWAGQVLSPENSQQFTDWYTFSHIIHGFIFYFFARLAFPKAAWHTWLLIAVGVEVAWEVLENTPMVINHYREQALAQGYTGDSILNSLMDTLMMAVGFMLARKLPVWVVVVLALSMEVIVGFIIHDNLTLNVINLIYQFEFIRDWQGS